jgi:Alpha-1,3-glucanase catalytic domain D1/Alpha-1,3-glucanase catalytic domain D2
MRTRALLILVMSACSARLGAGAPGDAIDGAVGPGDSGGDGDGGMQGAIDASLPPPGRGATVPWIEYEAEDGVTTGTIVGPSREVGTPAGEASGRRAVILDATGQRVTWTVTADANAIVVRYSIPDAPQGGGTRATLSVYVDDHKRASLALDSKAAWIYGDDGTQVDAPSAGHPRRIYTEAHALLGATIPAGAHVALVKEAGDHAPSYAIDFIDLEPVPPPIEPPAGFLSITEPGHPWAPAVPDDGKPDDDAINQCLAAAMAGQYAGVYIPPGRFEQAAKLQVKGTTVQGAGMWYSTLFNASLAPDPGWGQTGFIITGDGATFRDFAIVGSTDGLRAQGGKAWVNSAFNDTHIENMWVENVQCAYWVGGTEPSNRLVIRNSRFRDTGADAVNLCNGTADSIIENDTARNTGDDAFAIWSATDLYPHPDTNNVIRHCTVQITWRAAAFAIYGGTGNRIEDSVAYDTLTYPGLTISTEYAPYPMESATVENVSLIRTGGTYWGGQDFGAIWVRAEQNPTRGITIRNVDVIEPSHQGILIQGDNGGVLGDVLFDHVTIDRPASYGIEVKAGAAGRATFKDVTITNAGAAARLNGAAGSFTLDDGGGNTW